MDSAAGQFNLGMALYLEIQGRTWSMKFVAHAKSAR